MFDFICNAHIAIYYRQVNINIEVSVFVFNMCTGVFFLFSCPLIAENINQGLVLFVQSKFVIDVMAHRDNSVQMFHFQN